MATIRELNFDVKLLDEKFDKQIRKDIDLAKELNISMSKALDLRKKLTEAATKGSDSILKESRSMETLRQKTEETKVAMDKQTDSVKKTNTALKGTSDVMRELSQLVGVTFGVVALKRFFSSLIDITGQFEVQKMALRTMLQDVAAADKIFQDLYEFSSKSTYRFSELAQHAKQLAGFGIDKNDLLETTKMLGDVASGLGVSMDRIILAYGHVKSSGFLRGIQLRSFSQNGVPILEELAKILTEIEGKAVSLGDVFDKMTRREITFDMVEEAFKRMTGEGGKFYKMQETLAETIAGKINIIKGKWENALGATGLSNNNVFKQAADAVIFLLDHLELVGAVVKSVFVGAGMYGVGLLAKGIVNLGKSFFALIAPARAAAAGITAVGMSTQAALGWIGLLATAVVSLIDHFRGGTDELTEFRHSLEDMREAKLAEALGPIEHQIGRLERLNQKLHDNTAAQKERQDALMEIQSIVPGYLAQLTAEGTLINDNADAITAYTDKLRKSAKAHADFEYLTELYKEQRRLTEEVNKQANEYQKVSHGADFGLSWQGVVNNAAYAWNQMTLGYGAESSAAVQAVRTWQAWKTASDELAYVNSQISTYQVEVDKAMTSTSGWRKDIHDTYEELKKSTKYMNANLEQSIWNPGNDVDDSEWVDKVLKEEKELLEKTKKGTEESQEAAKLQLELLQELKKTRPEVAWDELNASGHIKPTSDALSDSQKAFKDYYNNRVADLRTFISEYQALLRQGKTDEEVKTLLPQLYPDMGADAYKSLDRYYEELRLIARLMEEHPELWSKRDVGGILRYLGKAFYDDAKDAEKNVLALKRAMQDYKDLIASWSEKDFALSGTGITLDINKALRDYNNKLASINGERRKAQLAYVEELTTAEGVRTKAREIIMDRELSDEEKLQRLKMLNLEGFTEAQFEAIDKIAEAEMWSEKALAQEKIKNLAKNYLKEKELDPSNLSKMTIGQLNKYKSDLEELRTQIKTEGFGDEELQKRAEKLGISFDESIDGIDKLIDAAKKLADSEEWKKIARLAKFAAGQIKNLAKELGELGEASGDDSLKNIADMVDSIGNAVSNIAAGFAAGGPWGAAIAAVSTIASELINMSIAEEEAKKKAYDLREALRVLSMERALSGGVDSVFGTDELQSVENAIRLMDELMSKLRAGREWVTQEARYRRNRSGRVIEMRPEIREILQAGDWRVRTYKSRSFNDWFGLKDDEYKTLNELAGGSIYDENGFIDLEKIKEIKNAYGDDGKNSFLDELVDDAEKYNKALETVKSTLEGVLGDVVDDLADKFIDKWIEARDVTIDYADTLDDVAKAFAKLAVKKLLFEELFNDDKQKELLEYVKSGDYAGLTGEVANLMNSVQNLGPQVAQILQAFDPYFDSFDQTSGSVGQGIKGITEDTADLLASYINAMRADVSYMRSMQEAGWLDVRAIADAVASPTLNEYLAECAANTFDIAQSNAQILSELQSVIGNPGEGGRVMRVEALI